MTSILTTLSAHLFFSCTKYTTLQYKIHDTTQLLPLLLLLFQWHTFQIKIPSYLQVSESMHIIPLLRFGMFLRADELK
jgi:hypothetical protein